ncbi:MAG: phosphoglycerate kinase, partial [Gemmatimonadetes bacterium]|nr:phosphoglycerate kinase [Gemmatimonadota bacterium]
IEALLPKVDTILIGGAMACTFFAALGYQVGNSLVEPEKVGLAKDLLERGKGKIILPQGATIAQEISGSAAVRQVPLDAIPDAWAMYDIDSATGDSFAATIREAATVLWNGPMGVFETPPFDAGTRTVALALADATSHGATTVVGGGDSAAAIANLGLQDRVTHVSTGGGAALEYLEGKELPAIAALDDA